MCAYMCIHTYICIINNDIYKDYYIYEQVGEYQGEH